MIFSYINPLYRIAVNEMAFDTNTRKKYMQIAPKQGMLKRYEV